MSDDFYMERLAVAKLDSWSRGRVALVGDAAHCPSRGWAPHAPWSGRTYWSARLRGTAGGMFGIGARRASPSRSRSTTGSCGLLLSGQTVKTLFTAQVTAGAESPPHLVRHHHSMIEGGTCNFREQGSS